MTALATIQKQKTQSPEDLLTIFAKAAVTVHFPEVDQYGNPNLGRFLIEHGRLPIVTDDVKPWSYRGWIVPYIQMCELHPDVAPRYGYVERTIQAGKILNEPIPKINFVGEGSREAAEGTKMLGNLVRTVEQRTGYSRGIEQLCEWLAFGLGAAHEPSKLDDEIQEQLYRQFDVSRWLLRPTDYIGQYLAEVGHAKGGGFFPTPMNVCVMMAEMTHGHAGRSITDTVCDPCVGTGRLLLASSNYALRLFGVDINHLCVLATKINLALYAPWFYIPDSFFPEQRVTEPPPAVDAKVDGTRRSTGEPKVFTTKIEQPTLFDL